MPDEAMPYSILEKTILEKTILEKIKGYKSLWEETRERLFRSLYLRSDFHFLGIIVEINEIEFCLGYQSIKLRSNLSSPPSPHPLHDHKRLQN